MLLEANNNILVISPERSDLNVFNNLKENKNLLSDKFKTFEQMLKNDPAISAEINIEQLFHMNRIDIYLTSLLIFRISPEIYK